MDGIYLTIVLAPLTAAVIAGPFGQQIGRAGSHTITIAGVALSFGLSCFVLKGLVIDGADHNDAELLTGTMLVETTVRFIAEATGS